VAGWNAIESPIFFLFFFPPFPIQMLANHEKSSELVLPWMACAPPGSWFADALEFPERQQGVPIFLIKEFTSLPRPTHSGHSLQAIEGRLSVSFFADLSSEDRSPSLPFSLPTKLRNALSVMDSGHCLAGLNPRLYSPLVSRGLPLSSFFPGGHSQRQGGPETNPVPSVLGWDGG